MRVRVRFDPENQWIVETKRWYSFYWYYQARLHGDNAYKRACVYARALKYPQIEEIK